MKEIISIHIGQAGIQIGNACWDLYCAEHQIQPDGLREGSSVVSGTNTLFSEGRKGKYVPRALFADLEPLCVDEIRYGAKRDLFNPSSLINDLEGGSFYSRAHYTVGRKVGEESLERLRKLVEDCDGLSGLMIFNGTDGGSGLGVGALIVNRIAMDYRDIPIINVAIMPSPTIGPYVVGPLNFIHGFHNFLSNASAIVAFDNEALYRTYEKQMHVESVSYNQINRLIAQVVSGITSPIRFASALNSTFHDMLTNLIPCDHNKILMPSISPLVHVDQAHSKPISVHDMLLNAFDPSNALVSYNSKTNYCIASNILFRGDVFPSEVNRAIAQLKTKSEVKFVDWAPTGIKCGITLEPPKVVPNSEFAPLDKSVTVLSNNTAISTALRRITRKFDLIYAKRAFVHWFVGEGMSEGEFSEARYVLIRSVTNMGKNLTRTKHREHVEQVILNYESLKNTQLDSNSATGN